MKDDFQHIAEKLPDTADEPSDEKRAQTVFEMVGFRGERIDVGDIIFIVVFSVFSVHRAPFICPPPADGRERRFRDRPERARRFEYGFFPFCNARFRRPPAYNTTRLKRKNKLKFPYP